MISSSSIARSNLAIRNLVSKNQPYLSSDFRNFFRTYSKMASQKVICTHSGHFHCDEALACWMLKQLDEYKTAKIVRSRDPSVVNAADIVVDVGSVYDPSNHRYDHHQREFSGTFDDKHKTRLSSAGLIYKHFGKRVLSEILGDRPSDHLELFYQKIYDDFIEGIDGIDNGVNQYPADVKPAYRVKTDLGSRVGWLNPEWNQTDFNEEVQFSKAMDITGHDFLAIAKAVADCWYPARAVVEEALANRKNVHESGEIIILTQQCPWKSHLYELEQELQIEGQVKFILYEVRGEKSWRIQCMSITPESFTNRLSLLDAWKGKRDDELSQISGIPGCTFVHATGFIGGNHTKEGVLSMAVETLKSKA